jgi:hypothetical protein
LGGELASTSGAYNIFFAPQEIILNSIDATVKAKPQPGVLPGRLRISAEGTFASDEGIITASAAVLAGKPSICLHKLLRVGLILTY